MTLSSALFSLLMALPIHRNDKAETAYDRVVRMARMAVAISSAADRAACYQQDTPCRTIYSDRFEMAGITFELGRAESAFAEGIQGCRCLRYECDPYELPDGTIVFLARGPWQQHQFGLAARNWDRLCADIGVAAWTATVTLAGAIGACGGRVAAGISRYGLGGGCVAPLGKPRADRAAVWTQKLRRMVTE